MTTCINQIRRTTISNCCDLFLPDSGATDEYCRGVLVGMISVLMANGKSFNGAMREVIKHCRIHIRNPKKFICETWLVDWNKNTSIWGVGRIC